MLDPICLLYLSLYMAMMLVIRVTTLNIQFGATYKLELGRAMIIFNGIISHRLPTNAWIGCLDIDEHEHLHLVENYIDDKKKDIALWNFE